MMTTSRRRLRQAGLSLVELMVGITIGLIVVAAASLMMTNQVTENSRLLVETQLQQDLRAAAELMLHEMRRAGYNGKAEASVWSPSNPTPVANIYAPTRAPLAPTVAPAQTSDRFFYAYDRGSNAVNMPATNESFGFLLAKDENGKGVLFAVNGTSFAPVASPPSFDFPSGVNPAQQPLTDPALIDITDFKVTLISQPTSMGAYANPPQNCVPGAPNCPCLIVRRVDISITANAVRDTAVQRTIKLSGRIRNDQILPSC